MGMTFYHLQLNKIKEKGVKDYIKIKHNEKDIILKIVDESDETIHLLTKWRKLYKHMFASNFQMNEKRTKKWINKKKSKDEQSILFMIYVDGQKIGNIGTDLFNENNNSVELDNMMKDPNCLEKGLMTTVEKVYLKWMFDYLKVSKICGRLFTDNFRMLNAHLKCGWKIIDVSPLQKEINDDGWTWKETQLKSDEDIVERYFHVIELTKNDLMEKFGDIKYEVLF
jgi:RimJ/RimL family protein N-acetyltransferase